ncbi:MAG: TIGR02147 family protein [Proteobacteria bacterium]|nr:TIGR02147 family protein [Pseudomonadota bacterium]
MKNPAIFDYLDYRSYLRDMFGYRKEKDKKFSFRYFANKAGFASPNFIQLVFDGKRNLTADSLSRIAKGFGLKKKEREFFENLVFMNQAKNHDDKNYYYQKIMAIKGVTSIYHLEKAGYEYFSKWYYPVIREVILFGNGMLTAEDIAKLLNPTITLPQATKALDILIELKLIFRNQNGLWEVTDKAVTTGPEVESLVIANFHREMIAMAKEAIERFPRDKRDISSLTLSINEDSITELKRKIAMFRKELLQFACDEKESNQVVQINFQLFPVTEPYVKEKSNVKKI